MAKHSHNGVYIYLSNIELYERFKCSTHRVFVKLAIFAHKYSSEKKKKPYSTKQSGRHHNYREKEKIWAYEKMQVTKEVLQPVIRLNVNLLVLRTQTRRAHHDGRKNEEKNMKFKRKRNKK